MLPVTEILARADVSEVIAVPEELKGPISVPFTAEGTSANAELHPSPLLPPVVVDTKPLPGPAPVGRPGEEAADRISSILGVEDPCHRCRGLEITKFPRLACVPLTPPPFS